MSRLRTALAGWRTRRDVRRDERAMAEVREIVDTDAWLAQLIDPNRDLGAARKSDA